jgi:nitrogen fixation NifU-like protein
VGFEDLYREIILDHYRHPRNAAHLDDVPEEMVHENPSCGDALKLEVRHEDGVVASARFEGRGCAISMASASMMTELVRGRPVEEARALADAFIRVMRGEEPPERLEEWGDLAALGGVIQFPLRVKCATLAWHALRKSLS